MAFDGITVAAVTKELNEKLSGGRVYKIAQPEADALLLTVKTAHGQYRLLLSADASLPLVYLTDSNKPSPMTAPNFCMVMRKHLQNARILGFSQPGLERIIRMEVEHLDEMGDLCRKTLVTEIMGKHSNIILTDSEEKIVDSIKRISGMVSSVREVLPGRPYFVPQTTEKADPLLVVQEEFLGGLQGRNMPVDKAIMTCYMGISPQMASEMLRLSGVDSRMDAKALLAEPEALQKVWHSFADIMKRVKCGEYSPCIYYENEIPLEFAAIDTQMYAQKKAYDSISALLQNYYAEKEAVVRIRQRSTDLRRIVQTAVERNAKKLELQEKQLKDTQKREKMRLYGELLNAYGYQIPAGVKEYEALNYHDNTTVKIPLDETLSASENAKKYFEKYGKQKRTCEALSRFVEETKAELAHLESIQVALDIARKEEDLLQIRQELTDCGFIRKKSGAKKEKVTSRPLHFVTEDGFHIYVGKNNYQNEEVTFQLANGGDWWFHARKLPGSHVVVRTEGRELPDRVFEQAAALAAYYSKAADQEKAEVDYVKRKEVKKPAGAAPGFVVYYTNYSMVVKPGIVGLTQAD
ncbi:MAG: NFACT family protein [Lachnospiraceae bacterium]|nr:NFACT family protein [Lachnospiraceae bacterium]